MPVALLLAMQAAGMIVDFIGAQNQAKWMKLGSDLESAGFEANLEMTRLQSEDESVQAMKALRQNLGSQIASYAARGTAVGAGNAILGINESVGSFKSDERMRRLNLMGKENQLRSNKIMSQLGYMSESSKLWQGFASRTLNRFPTSKAGWEQGLTDIKGMFT